MKPKRDTSASASAHAFLSAALVLTLGACSGTSTAPKADDPAQRESGTRRPDSSGDDASNRGLDAGRDSGVKAALDAALDADWKRDTVAASGDEAGSGDAIMDSGTNASDRADASVLLRCPADAATARWDYPTWPEPELQALDVAALDTASCQISYDARDDGVVERRFGYDYDDSGRLVREFSWVNDARAFDAPKGLQVIEYQRDGRPRAVCAGSSCRLIVYDDRSHSARVAAYDATGVVILDGKLDIAYDDQGRIARWHSCATDRSPYMDTGQYDLGLVDGVLRTAEVSDSEREEHSKFGADGQLAMLASQHDPELLNTDCSEDGWETRRDECDDFDCSPSVSGEGLYFRTEYVRNIDGRLMSSRTKLSYPDAASFSTAYTWSPDGRAVELVSRDDAGHWTDVSTVYLDPPPSKRELDENGNVTVIRFDEDRDGSFELVDRYSYSGHGACVQGKNPQLAPKTIAEVTDPSNVTLARACRYSPVTSTLERMLMGRN